MPANNLISLDLSELTKYFNALGDPRLTINAVKTGMRAGGESLRANVQQNLTGRILRRVTGQLIRSVYVDQPKEEAAEITVTYGSRGVPYAAIHEFGGIIQAKNKPYLVFKPQGVDHFVKVKQVTMPERRPFRDAGERSLSSFKEQIALYTIKALKEAGKL